ncbi:hypothetical protein AB205_0196470 [Aquarana catesbeiana]|uniref:MADF domain-containing protein n=1 Tax=Aquarana catesbeiana TaxID=8400 RepID=A0A2G9QHW0_AQUCT|nr:hypothetical protein AB205_0196470 [Aquarana catesbeiana]
MSVSRREVVHRKPIDNECLIRIVRQRPCLYDKDDPTYRDQIKKDNAWLEICRGSFEDWDIMTNSQHSEKFSAIQVRWKGLRDCYKRYLRKLLEARSGSGSKRVVPYVHAEELEFLRPSMELRETQSSWQVAQEGQEAPPEPQGLQEHRSLDETMTQKMNPEILDTQETAGPSQVQRPEPEPMQARSTRTARPRGIRVDNIQRFG